MTHNPPALTTDTFLHFLPLSIYISVTDANIFHGDWASNLPRYSACI